MSLVKGRLYEVARRALAVAAIFAVVTGGTGASQVAMLPGGPADAAVSDPVDAYLSGMWHLSLAAGRASCQGVQFTAELRSLTARDVSWTDRGTLAAIDCGTSGKSSNVLPVDLDATDLTDLRTRLDSAQSDYRQLVEPGRCWSGRASDSVAALADVLYSVGQAAAAATCAIASWNRVQSPYEADAVRAYLHAARIASPAIADRALRTVVDARVKAALAQLDKQSGETLYHAIVGVFEATRTELRRTR